MHLLFASLAVTVNEVENPPKSFSQLLKLHERIIRDCKHGVNFITSYCFWSLLEDYNIAITIDTDSPNHMLPSYNRS